MKFRRKTKPEPEPVPFEPITRDLDNYCTPNFARFLGMIAYFEALTDEETIALRHAFGPMHAYPTDALQARNQIRAAMEVVHE